MADVAQVGEALPQFNSGRRHQILTKIEEVTTAGQRIIILPAYSVQPARKRGSARIMFRIGDKQHAISAGTRNVRAAEANAKALLARWLASRSITLTSGSTGLQADAEAFIREQFADRKHDTRNDAQMNLRRLFAAFPEVKRSQEMTVEIFRAGADRLRGNAAPKYWAGILSTCRRFSRWMVERGIIAQDFTKGVPMPARDTFGQREAIWTDEYLATVCDAVAAFDAEVIQVMRWCGIDSSDVWALRTRHFVRDETGVLTIRKVREKAKGKEETIVQPVSSRVRPLIEARIKAAPNPDARLYGAGWVNGRSFTSSLRGRVKRSLAPHSITLIDLKSLRHTFATYHAERDVPMDVLRRWMGHSRDSRVLERVYLHRRTTARYMD